MQPTFDAVGKTVDGLPDDTIDQIQTDELGKCFEISVRAVMEDALQGGIKAEKLDEWKSNIKDRYKRTCREMRPNNAIIDNVRHPMRRVAETMKIGTCEVVE
ncbi:MAG: hypothetical protein JXA73_22825 [Acidobacteria bacterium]|nr:hypothetical protein [Acidobacteriota bacterium]